MKAVSNDIPEYLKGKSAAEICNDMRVRIVSSNSDTAMEDYVYKLEQSLIIAVKDALCNCDRKVRVDELVLGIHDGPGERAIAFLNMILPKEGGNEA